MLSLSLCIFRNWPLFLFIIPSMYLFFYLVYSLFEHRYRLVFLENTRNNLQIVAIVTMGTIKNPQPKKVLSGLRSILVENIFIALLFKEICLLQSRIHKFVTIAT